MTPRNVRELATQRVASDTRTGARDSKRNARLRAAAAAAQRQRCAWCTDPLGADTAGPWQVQLDRLASGRDMGRCRCQGPCRCAYLPGNVVAAHRACHDPELGARRSLTDSEELALALANAPTAQALEQELRPILASAGALAAAAAQALRRARAAAAALPAP